MIFTIYHESVVDQKKKKIILRFLLVVQLLNTTHKIFFVGDLIKIILSVTSRFHRIEDKRHIRMASVLSTITIKWQIPI